MQQVDICRQSGPTKHDLNVLQKWLISPEGNNSALEGEGWDAWEEQEGRLRDTEYDYIVLSSNHRNRDRFEHWAGDTLLRFYHRLIGRRLKVSYTVGKVSMILILQNKHIKDEEFGLAEYNDTKISIAADIVCTLTAPLLTTIPMFVLYFVRDVEKRLGIIMGFTTLFSIRSVPFVVVRQSILTTGSLALFSSARRIEVFAATSAFAAVLVVYGTVNQ